jgi:hypothetical protein
MVTKLIIGLSIFGFGFCAGALAERSSLKVAEDRTSIVYEGSIYLQAVAGTTLEDYLTAAGKGRK